MIQRYLRSMERAEYATLLNVIENYARVINSLFTQLSRMMTGIRSRAGVTRCIPLSTC
jgi:hypothetical protein